MKIKIDEVTAGLIGALKLAYRVDGRSEFQPFEAWMQGLKNDPYQTSTLLELVEHAPREDLSKTEEKALEFATQVLAIGIHLGPQIEDMLPTAIAGVKLAYRLSGRGKIEHFDDWIKRLMQHDHGPALELHTLLEAAPMDGLSSSEVSSILLARQFGKFAVMMIMDPSFTEILPAWDISEADCDPLHPESQIDDILQSLTGGMLEDQLLRAHIPTADVQRLIIEGLHLVSFYIECERTWEVMLSDPDIQELNDLCREALALPNLGPDHRSAILVPYQVLQGILLLDKVSARFEAEVNLRGKIEARNLKLDHNGVASLALSDLKWLIIRGVDLSVCHLGGDETEAEVFECMNAGYLNEACVWGLVSPSLDLDHRHAIVVASESVRALLNLDEPGARSQVFDEFGLQGVIAKAA